MDNMDAQTISLVIDALTLVAVLVGGIFGLISIYLLWRQIRSQYEWGMRENALHYSLTKSEQARVARLNLERLFGLIPAATQGIPLEDIDKEIEENPAVSTDIRILLSHWENMALAIHAKVADETVCYEMASGSIINTTQVFRNYIDRVRRQRPDVYRYLHSLSFHCKERKDGATVVNFADLREL